MSALRIMMLTDQGRRPRVLLYAPALYEMAFKQRHVDGEALALFAYLRGAGYDVTLLDAYYRAGRVTSLDEVLATQPFDIVVVHLWTSDAYGPRLRQIADELAAARRSHHIAVVGFGSLATSAVGELTAHGAMDHAVGLAPTATVLPPLLAELSQGITEHLRGHTPLTSITAADLAYQPDAVVSVSASRGCRSRCTFCAYNADLNGGWHPLAMTAAVADIAHLHSLTGATRFSFADTDFGGSRDVCSQRATQLRTAMTDTDLTGVVTMSMSIRSETLDPETVAILASAGVRTFLIGVESFDADTLHRLYGKRMDLDHMRRVIDAADECGITTVASYILWHPWQTIDKLRHEIDAIDKFGRWRIPQFMARSRLLVIPGTVAERHIRAGGLLDEQPFHRSFRFADQRTTAINGELTQWFLDTAVPVIEGLSENRPEDLTTLAHLKMHEWDLLKALTGASSTSAGAQHG